MSTESTSGDSQPTEEKKQTVFQWAAKALEAHAAGFQYSDATTSFDCGVAHGLIDFTRATTQTSMGEEHRTSAVVGFIAAHLSWYNLLAEMSEAPRALNCQWGSFKKSEETQNGSDFGVAIEIGPVDGRDGHFYNLSFFQAKNGSTTKQPESDAEDGEGFDINQPHTDYAKTPREADKRLAAWLGIGNPSTPWESWLGAPSQKMQSPDIKHNHQVVKLAVANAYLAQLNNQSLPQAQQGNASLQQPSYVHYVVWRNYERPAQVVSLKTVKSLLAQRKLPDLTVKSGIKDPTLHPDPQYVEAFGDFLRSGQNAGAAGWALIEKQDVIDLVKNWPTIGTHWMIVETRKGDLANTLGLASTIDRGSYPGNPVSVPMPKTTLRKTPGPR